MFDQSISIAAAFGAGLLSFFSPCIIPILPAYFSFITGVSVEDLLEKEKDLTKKKKIVGSTILFILGFTTIFVLMGVSASAAGSFFLKFKDYLRIAGGIIILIFGLHISNIIPIKFLQYEKRFEVKKNNIHWIGTFIAGTAFAAGWTPCIGPILGSILVLAGGQETMLKGGYLLFIYSLGLAIPFFILSFFIHLVVGFMRKTGRYMGVINLISGVLLIFMGIVLITNKMDFILSFFI